MSHEAQESFMVRNASALRSVGSKRIHDPALRCSGGISGFGSCFREQRKGKAVHVALIWTTTVSLLRQFLTISSKFSPKRNYGN